MLSEGKNIDQVFRGKAEAFNPGRALLDADWAGISGQLPVKEKRRKPIVIWLRSAAAVAAILILFFAIKGITSRNSKQAAEQPIARVTTLPADTGKTATVPIKDSLKNIIAYPYDLALLKNFRLSTWFHEQDNVFTTDSAIMNTYNQLASFQEQVAVASESFTISNNRDNTINCKKGTNIFIPANTFYSGGSLINGEVTFSVTEYYTLGEMAAAKLNTTSGGRILKSGGMLFIQAVYNDHEVDENLRNRLTVNMPAVKEFDPKMQLFLPANNNAYPTRVDLNAWKSEGANASNTFEWMPAGQIQSASSISEQPKRASVPVSGPDTVSRNRPILIPRSLEFDLPPVRISTINLVQPYKIIEKTNTLVFLADYLDKKEEDSIIARLQRRHPGFNIKLRSAFVGSKQFITQTEDRLPQYISSLRDSTWMPFMYAYKNGFAKPADSARYNNWLERQRQQDTIRYISLDYTKKAIERKENFDRGIKVLENRYNFSISKLGWINCDRFYDDPREKAPLYIKLDAVVSDYTVHVVFPRINSISGMMSFEPGNLIRFMDFPLNEPIYIVAVGVRKGKIVTGFKETKVTKEPVTGILFEETGAEAFKQKLSQMN